MFSLHQQKMTKLAAVKTSESVTVGSPGGDCLPDAAALAALRAWYEGMDSRAAVDQFIGQRRADGESSRGLIARLRQQVTDFARTRHRPDLGALFERAGTRGSKHAA